MNKILESRRFSMNAVQQTHTNRVRVMWLAVALALIAALSYIMIQLGMLGVGDLQPAEGSAAIVYVAAGSYLLGARWSFCSSSWHIRTGRRSCSLRVG